MYNIPPGTFQSRGSPNPERHTQTKNRGGYGQRSRRDIFKDACIAWRLHLDGCRENQLRNSSDGGGVLSRCVLPFMWYIPVHHEATGPYCCFDVIVPCTCGVPCVHDVMIRGCTRGRVTGYQQVLTGTWILLLLVALFLSHTPRMDGFLIR